MIVDLFLPSSVDYSSTTGAVVSFTCSLAVQLMPKTIRVNAVAPGPVYTVLQSGLRSPESVEGWGLSTAGQPIECGPSSVFLASSCDSNISTGQVVLVNSEWPSCRSQFLWGHLMKFLAFRWHACRRLKSSTRVLGKATGDINDRGKITLLAMNNSISSVRRRPKDVNLLNK